MTEASGGSGSTKVTAAWRGGAARGVACYNTVTAQPSLRRGHLLVASPEAVEPPDDGPRLATVRHPVLLAPRHPGQVQLRLQSGATESRARGSPIPVGA